MQSRRDILKGGLGIFALGAAAPIVQAANAIARPRATRSLIAPQLKAGRPLASVPFDPNPRIVGGFPFRSWFEGDDFDSDNIPFHSQQNDFPGGSPPEPTETVRVCVIGGGISGLASAHMLREHNPVVFELHERFGGNARGGVIAGAEYTLGSAYFITPDKDSELDLFYRDLGLHRQVRIDDSPMQVEINGQINDDIWSGMGVPPEDRPLYEAYRKLVLEMADNYPDVPFPEDWMRTLDRLSLREHIEGRLGQPAPASLAAAIQAYCYSSFGAGWEEISATLGWNFLAAEEFGRWVLPGGNAWMADALWQRLTRLDAADPKHAPHLRSGRRVVDLRVLPDSSSQVTWLEPDGSFRSLLARRVVMAAPKHVAQRVIQGLEQEEPERFNAMAMDRRAYLLANVVLDRPIPENFYDIFLLGNPADFPMSDGQAASLQRYTDVLNGSYAPGPNANQIPRRPGVLSLFWPLPYAPARFELVLGDPILHFAELAAPRLRETLALLGLPESSVLEIRFARWGHALPHARVGFLADGIPELISTPYKNAVHFVNQDNWALPAIENSVLDAIHAARLIHADLG